MATSPICKKLRLSPPIADTNVDLIHSPSPVVELASFGKHIFLVGDCIEQIRKFPKDSMSLIFSSPPYNIGKKYEKRMSLGTYLESKSAVIKEICRVLRPGGSLCWQVGNYVDNGAIIPLDLKFHELFCDAGLTLQKRFVWAFGHGLHCKYRLSGRYETVSWYSLGTPQNPCFELQFISQEWNDLFLEIPNVKSNHIEKTIHPCQFPVELVERFVLTLTKTGECVLDPYAGSGSTVIAAILHQRDGVGIDIVQEYIFLAKKRVKQLLLTVPKKRLLRPLGKAVHIPVASDSLATAPAEWNDVVNPSLLKEQEYRGKVTLSFESYQLGLVDTNLLPKASFNLLLIYGSESPLDNKILIDSLIHFAKKEANICVLFDHSTYGFNNCDANTLSVLAVYPLRNRVVCWCQERPGYVSILWFALEDYHFDLDAVRVPSKYPGKKSTTTGLYSGNPLGKNPSDCWHDCCGTCSEMFGVSYCHWKRLLRAFCPVGGNVLLSSWLDLKCETLLSLSQDTKRCLHAIKIFR